MSNRLWADDKVQFARLLCEITATTALDHGGWVDLLKSMDLETEELGELFERADKVWEAAKLEPPPLTHCSGCGTGLDGSYCPKCEPPEPKIELQRLEAAFAEAGGRGVELAERIDELRKRANTVWEGTKASIPWAFGEIRDDLTDEQVEHIKSMALDALRADGCNDIDFLVETVEHLADDQPLEWWLETVTNEPDMWEELLGFNPLVEGDGPPESAGA